MRFDSLRDISVEGHVLGILICTGGKPFQDNTVGSGIDGLKVRSTTLLRQSGSAKSA